MENEQLVRRLNMIAQDLKIVRMFIHRNGISSVFDKPTEDADACWHHLNNIEIASDLDDDEPNYWRTLNSIDNQN